MPITVLKTIQDTRAYVAEQRGTEKEHPVVLVPTMGALHEGHAQLIRRARELAGADGTVLVSVFVNPTQFGPNEDLDHYPRTFERDEQTCEACGADAIFAPLPDEVYVPGHSMDVRETVLSVSLCGASRPGHFPGVCLVVLKLFNIVQPTQAVFGKKDYQQLAVIRRMVRDLNVPVDIVGAETVREADGLAMSSRNENLSEKERAVAPQIQRALAEGKALWERQADVSVHLLLRVVRSHLDQIPGGRVDYLELVDAHSLEPIRGTISGPVVCATAYAFPRARLIDNIEFGPVASEG